MTIHIKLLLSLLFICNNCISQSYLIHITSSNTNKSVDYISDFYVAENLNDIKDKNLLRIEHPFLFFRASCKDQNGNYTEGIIDKTIDEYFINLNKCKAKKVKNNNQIIRIYLARFLYCQDKNNLVVFPMSDYNLVKLRKQSKKDIENVFEKW